VGRGTNPRLRHYVPQLHLRRFLGASGRLWIWDREQDRVFRATPRAVAADARFYDLDEFAAQGHDRNEMERQFSAFEDKVSRITVEWIEWIRNESPQF
jgi:hypothetical protein